MPARDGRPEAGQGTVLRIEHASIHDGEGIQTVVFLQGCPLRCAWCSTPEGMSPRPVTTAEGKTYGRVMDADGLMREIEKDEAFFFHSGGGVTFSGGEPLLQPGFVAELCRRCHYLGIRTTLESSLGVAPDALGQVLPHLDLLYADLKHMDGDRHRALTGLDNEQILANLRTASAHGPAPGLVIRVPLVPSVNDDLDNLERLARFCSGLPALRRVELLPYHRLGVGRYRELGLAYPLRDLKPPTRPFLEAKAAIIRSAAPGLEVAVR